MEYLAFKALNNENGTLSSPYVRREWRSVFIPGLGVTWYLEAGQEDIEHGHGIFAATLEEARRYGDNIYLVAPWFDHRGEVDVIVGSSGWRASAAIVVAEVEDERAVAEIIVAAWRQGYRQIPAVLGWAVGKVGDEALEAEFWENFAQDFSDPEVIMATAMNIPAPLNVVLRLSDYELIRLLEFNAVRLNDETARELVIERPAVAEAIAKGRFCNAIDPRYYPNRTGVLMKLARNQALDEHNSLLLIEAAEQSPATKPILRELAYHTRHVRVMEALIEKHEALGYLVMNKHAPREILIRVAYAEPGAAWQLASYTLLDKDMMYVLAEHPDEQVRLTLASRRDLPGDLVQRLATDPSKGVRATIVRNYDLPENLLLEIIREARSGDADDEDILAGAALRSSSIKVLTYLAETGSEKVLSALMGNYFKPSRALRIIAERTQNSYTRVQAQELLRMRGHETNAFSFAR